MRTLHLGLLLLSANLAAQAAPSALDALDTLPLHTAPLAVTAKAIDTARHTKGQGPALFAVAVNLPVTLDGGIWDTPEPGIARWRTRVFSAGARALLLNFERFALPPEARLWLYAADGSSRQGPYTEADQSADGTLQTAIISGETAVIVVELPQRQQSKLQLQLARLGHAYKDLNDLGDAQACEINIACPLGNDWRNESRAVVKLQILAGDGYGVCSGTLLNNTAQDDRPYILTADHCGIGRDGNSPANVVVYWNFQSNQCNRNSGVSDQQNQSGVILRARDTRTDMTLLELNRKPNPDYAVYYAGWDASGSGANEGVSIHHPSGDAKKISQYTQPLVRDTVQIEARGPQIPAWRVSRWAQGSTEPGSSGSGLWNQDRQLIGSLSGGNADCPGGVYNGGSDYYARLSEQWLANSATNGQLKAWLDAGNTGQLKIAGKNPDTTATPQPTATPAPTSAPTPAPTAAPTAAPQGDGGGGMGLGFLLTALGFAGMRRVARQ